ncbi:MAG: nucleoside triphosphate pyrophosphohydrolase [Patescibacteria group bacterium]
MPNKKLIRDNIPRIAKAKGETIITRTASKTELWALLQAKLKEEVHEYLDNPSPEELADIMEVVHALSRIHRLSPKKLEHLRKKKARKRGAFKKRIVLILE